MVRTGKKMTILKGSLDGFSYFSLISVILFINQNHPSIKLTSVISQGSNIYNFKENCTQILCPSIALVWNGNHFSLGLTQIKKCLNSKANYFQIMSVTGKKIRLPNLSTLY